MDPAKVTLKDTNSVDRRMRNGRWVALNCGECDFVGDFMFSQEGAPDTSVSTLSFKEYWNLSVVSWSHHP